MNDVARRENFMQAGQVKGHRDYERSRYQRSIGKLETLVVECSAIVSYNFLSFTADLGDPKKLVFVLH